MVKIKGMNYAKREIEEMKEALKEKKLISEEDLSIARKKLDGKNSRA